MLGCAGLMSFVVQGRPRLVCAVLNVYWVLYAAAGIGRLLVQAGQPACVRVSARDSAAQSGWGQLHQQRRGLELAAQWTRHKHCSMLRVHGGFECARLAPSG
jgi:hypothetical protein